MISTGREYDRFVIALMIVSIFLLAVYVIQCNKTNSNTIKKQDEKMSDRLDYLTQQINQTSQNVKDYMDTPNVEEEKVEDNVPNPVTSSFLG